MELGEMFGLERGAVLSTFWRETCTGNENDNQLRERSGQWLTLRGRLQLSQLKQFPLTTLFSFYSLYGNTAARLCRYSTISRLTISPLTKCLPCKYTTNFRDLVNKQIQSKQSKCKANSLVFSSLSFLLYPYNNV